MPPEQEQTLASRLRAWAGMQTPSEAAASPGGGKNASYAEVASRFSAGGCEAISNAADMKKVADFQNESSAVKVKVPGGSQLNTAAQTCKAPSA